MARYQIIDADVGITYTLRDTRDNTSAVNAFREIVESIPLAGRVYEVTDTMLSDCGGDQAEAEVIAVSEMVTVEALAAFVAKYPDSDIGGCLVEVHYLKSKPA